MKAKQKKRIILLGVLLLVLALLVVAYFVISNLASDEGGDVTPSSRVSVVSENSAAISAISYTVGDDKLSFIREASGKWYYESDRDFPLNQSYLTKMAEAVSSVTASRELDGDTGEYGFDSPALTINADYTTGNTYTLIIGDTNSFNSSVYLKDASGKVYMFSDSVSESFKYKLNELIQLDSPEADVDTNYLVSMDITTEKGEFKSITDSVGMNKVLSQSNAYECVDWVEYAMDESKFAEYGIGDSSPQSYN